MLNNVKRTQYRIIREFGSDCYILEIRSPYSEIWQHYTDITDNVNSVFRFETIEEAKEKLEEFKKNNHVDVVYQEL